MALSSLPTASLKALVQAGSRTSSGSISNWIGWSFSMYDAANPNAAAVMITSASVLASDEGRFETMPVVLLNGMIPLLHGGGVRESTPERTQGSIDGLDRVFRHDG